MDFKLNIQYGILYGVIAGVLGGLFAGMLISSTQLILNQLSTLSAFTAIDFILVLLGSLPLMVIGLFYGAALAVPWAVIWGAASGLLIALTKFGHRSILIGISTAVGGCVLNSSLGWSLPTDGWVPTFMHNFPTAELVMIGIAAVLGGWFAGWIFGRWWENLQMLESW